MNNKYLKYFLIIAVVCVWAAIIFRVIHGISTPDGPKPIPFLSVKKNYAVALDTFNLYADYPDPFLSVADTAFIDTLPKKSSTEPMLVSTNKEVLTEEAMAAIVQFNGSIDNPAKRSRIGFITVRGKEYVVREGEKIENMRIRKIGKIDIHILYKGELFTIGKL